MQISILCPSSSRAARRHPALRVLLLLFVGLLAFAGRTAHAAIKITFDLKDGAKISDVTTLVAHIDSTVGIDKVEFRVDDQLRFTSMSTPYQYKWDTIVDTEGKHTMTVTAYDSNGQTKRTTLALEIDNEIATGADALAQKAQEALTTRDVEAANRYARRAVKADPGNLAAARVLAGISANNGNYGRAADTLAKARGLDDSSDALLELASYRMHYALLPENAAKFITAIQEVNTLRHKAADMAVEQAKKQHNDNTPAAHEAIGDALYNAGRFPEAIEEYARSAGGDNAPLTSVCRLGLAYVQTREYRRATEVLEPYMVSKKADAAVRAVYALMLLGEQKIAEARKIVAPDLSDHVPASLVVAAYADTLLEKHREAATQANDVVSLLPNSGDAQYALSVSTQKVEDSEKALYSALSLSPFQPGPLVDYAARVVLTKRQDRYDTALDITDFVLKMDPQNVTAKLIQAMIYVHTNRKTDAKPILEKLYHDEPKAPDVLLSMSAYCKVLGDGALTSSFLGQAALADKTRFGMTQPPSPLESVQIVVRKLHYRADFFLTPSTLYPDKQTAAAR
jgi:predicted Zn-dependent protease